jgi:hypothetical protein
MKRRRNTPEGEYSVGYGKPPVAHQFKPGNKEHLKRSARAAKSEGKLFREIVGTPIKAERNGVTVYRNHYELLIEIHLAAALRGDVAAAAALLKIHQRSKDIGDLNPVVIRLNEVDSRL